MKITIESEALDSLKAMAQQLQDERDELLDAMQLANWYLVPRCNNGETTQKKMRDLIAKCTAKPEILA